MTLYRMAYTTKNGERVTGQLFTADTVTHTLKALESWECSDIKMAAVKPNYSDECKKLAVKLSDTLQNYDLYEYRDNDISVSTLMSDISDSPELIIDGLCDIINFLLES